MTSLMSQHDYCLSLAKEIGPCQSNLWTKSAQHTLFSLRVIHVIKFIIYY